MNISFTKYQASGNDFILFDERESKIGFKFSKNRISAFCDRRFGIGSDGILIIKPHKNFDFEVKYYNADGSEGMCCNGCRCAVHYEFKKEKTKKKIKIKAVDGSHIAKIGDNNIGIQMNNIDKIEDFGEDLFVNTGAPHYVRFIEDIKNKDIVSLGKSIRDHFRENTNVTFLEIDKNKNGSIFASTFEKGVEMETLSCGTGAVAAAISYSKKYKIDLPVTVNMKGGTFTVSFETSDNSKFKNIFITGDCKKVFEGQIEI